MYQVLFYQLHVCNLIWPFHSNLYVLQLDHWLVPRGKLCGLLGGAALTLGNAGVVSKNVTSG